MRILRLDESGMNDALALAENTLADAYGQDGVKAVISFLKERMHAYTCKGVYEEECLCGFIIYDEETYQIVFLLISAKARNKGYAAALLDDVRAEADELHLPRLRVNAAADMRSFYENYGFEETGEAKADGHSGVIPMEYLLGRQYLGKTVTVTVDRPYGSFHPHHPDVLYPLNYGYIDELISDAGEFVDAYVYGPEEPVETFKGVVSGIIYHRDGPSRFIVTSPLETVDPEKIMETVAFEEQYYDTRFIWHKELN